MDDKRKERLAIVTGASRGLGRAISLELARCGYFIVVNFRSDRQGAEKTLAGIRDLGADGKLMQFDVSDFDETRAAIDAVRAEFETIDVLVNNAGITDDELFVMMTPEKWHSVIDTSLNGFYNMTRPVVERMVVQKHGAVVSIASVSALMGNRGQANYAAGKAGLIAASRAVAAEVARLGVRVNVIAPGLIETDMIRDVPVKNIKSLIPMARIGKPEEVARAVRFLLSDDASYITGQVLSVNGGMV
jgi:3-oxoacyl-[acyl-carrier protein] reductase